MSDMKTIPSADVSFNSEHFAPRENIEKSSSYVPHMAYVVPADMPPLTPEIEREFRALQASVDEGLRDFLRVGDSLMRIRDNKYYRYLGFTVFGDYLSKYWGFSRSKSYEYIQAAGTASSFEDKTDMPENREQFQALNKLPETEREAYWKGFRKDSVASGDVPTARGLKSFIKAGGKTVPAALPPAKPLSPRESAKPLSPRESDKTDISDPAQWQATRVVTYRLIVDGEDLCIKEQTHAGGQVTVYDLYINEYAVGAFPTFGLATARCERYLTDLAAKNPLLPSAPEIERVPYGDDPV